MTQYVAYVAILFCHTSLILMSKLSIAIGAKSYVSIEDKQTKNHRGENNSELSQQGRMYETPGYEKCLVVSFEKYVAKLNPDCQAFWQRPAFTFKETSTRWFDKVPVGKNVLFDKMKNLSIEAKLSTVYTNHCLYVRLAILHWTTVGLKPDTY